MSSKKKAGTKRLVFYETDDRQARLRIRLKYDGLGQSDFFRLAIEFYLNNDERMIEMINEYKNNLKIRDKQQQKQRYQQIKQGKDVAKKFGIVELTNEEIESIFDIMEKEYSNL